MSVMLIAFGDILSLNIRTLPEPEVSLPDTVPELKKYSPDIKIYDQLIVPGGLQL